MCCAQRLPTHYCQLPNCSAVKSVHNTRNNISIAANTWSGMACMSAQQKLDQVLNDPDTRMNPPSMEEMFTSDYEETLVAAIKAAIASGIPPESVLSQVRISQ